LNSANLLDRPEIKVSEPAEKSLEEQVRELVGKEVGEKDKKATQASLHQMLTQAITSGDLELLELSLQVSNRKIINATVKKLNPTIVTQLLDQLVVRIQKRPNRASFLIEWIRACLLHHTGYLLSVNYI
jgi:U3 small nucleolar RNA-associated protein 5